MKKGRNVVGLQPSVNALASRAYALLEEQVRCARATPVPRAVRKLQRIMDVRRPSTVNAARRLKSYKYIDLAIAQSAFDYRAARLLSTVYVSLRSFNNKAWGFQARRMISVYRFNRTSFLAGREA